MASDLPQKVSLLISDFRTIYALIELVEHEMEKRIIARHGLVKLDALVKLLPQYKNEIRKQHHRGKKSAMAGLNALTARLIKDYSGSDMEIARDAMAAHALKLDLKHIVLAWQSMDADTFTILRDDLCDIDQELLRVAPNYPASTIAKVDATWPLRWAQEDSLGAPDQPRAAIIYPGLATAGILAVIPGGHAGQDTFIRAVGVATFLRQERLLLAELPVASFPYRLLAEMMVNDYLALWELLFDSHVTNEHGVPDRCVLDHWLMDGYTGVADLSVLKTQAVPNISIWRELRNKVTAHVDANSTFSSGDIAQWPISVDDVIDDALRVIEAFRNAAMHDIRTRVLFMRPTHLGPEAIGLRGDDERRWDPKRRQVN